MTHSSPWACCHRDNDPRLRELERWDAAIQGDEHDLAEIEGYADDDRAWNYVA